MDTMLDINWRDDCLYGVARLRQQDELDGRVRENLTGHFRFAYERGRKAGLERKAGRPLRYTLGAYGYGQCPLAECERIADDDRPHDPSMPMDWPWWDTVISIWNLGRDDALRGRRRGDGLLDRLWFEYSGEQRGRQYAHLTVFNGGRK
ncbi:hypothetical protein [Haloechinothrix halophila]|uniref:Uncharacterized protein n=1 Tax=Haloechinothrix halophila YIM 93223 TaxID=592678 RepID=W9DN89_9PSEU|nr:hypothetical protein [Haloechinothrix halophila]ETA66378.1 hypothetical protein AmyhaDRAFT_0132 [Haloechinothrix halophila YIM 93223]